MPRFCTRDQHLLGQVLTGREDHPDIKLSLSDKLIRIPAALALMMIRCAEYEWTGTHKRVYYMRPLKPPMPWRPSWRNSEAAVLQPSIDWMRGLLS